MKMEKREKVLLLLLLNPRPNGYLSLLNENVLVNIFKRLQLYDLLQIGELDVNYQRIIGEHIISKQTLDVSKVSSHYDTRQLFKHFGEYVTDLRICETDIQYKEDQYTFVEEIFRLINKRCIVGRLNSIKIYLNRREDQHTTRFVPDAFHGILSLRVQGDYSMCSNDLLEQVIPKCFKLRSLQIYFMHGNWNFLMCPQLQMLENLEIKACKIPSSAWYNFISMGIYSLTSLIFMQNSLVFNVCGAVIENQFIVCPFTIIGIKYPNLKQFSLLSKHRCSDFRGFYFRKLETMSLDAKGISFDLAHVKYLTNLRCLELVEYTSIPVLEAFLELPLLSGLTLNTYEIDASAIRAIVAASRYLRFLTLNSRKPRIAWTFYNSLVVERETRWPNAPPLHIYARFKDFTRHKPNVITIHRIN